MELTTLSSDRELEELLAASRQQPVLIFKHSIHCPISAEAHNEVRQLIGTARGFMAGMVVVQSARALSNKIEADLGIRHETPQAIVVRDGKATWSASHYDVTSDVLAEALGVA
jgi:bacillithiol system protein YtxJ